MLNYLWGFMLLIGIVYSAFTGNINEVTNAVLDSSKEAVSLCITMLGIMAVWVGIMEIAKETGLIQAISSKLQPVIRFLFPNIPRGHKANEYILVNMIANMLGLGWAATPAGLKAMEQLKTLQDERKGTQIASDEMCTFLVINISSLQLIPVNMIAYRSQYGSVNPALVVGPGLLATFLSTVAAVLLCKLFCKRRRERGLR